MTECKTSKHRMQALERQRRALELRTAGHSYQAIADALGYRGPAGAYQAVTNAATRLIQEPAEEVRRLELGRLDAMLRAIWPRVENGELGAISQALAIQDRRARYLGLDAPVRIDVEHRVREMAAEMGLDPDAAVAEAQAILRATKGRVHAGTG